MHSAPCQPIRTVPTALAFSIKVVDTVALECDVESRPEQEPQPCWCLIESHLFIMLEALSLYLFSCVHVPKGGFFNLLAAQPTRIK